jgi:hypothetical protein
MSKKSSSEIHQEPSQKRPYKSGYGLGYITPSEYIVELVCENIAAHNKIKLPLNYNSYGEWLMIIRKQLTICAGLLKLYPTSVIIYVLRETLVGREILSLGWQSKLDPILKQQFAQYKKTLQNIDRFKKQELVRTDEKPRGSFASRKNTINKLKGL